MQHSFAFLFINQPHLILLKEIQLRNLIRCMVLLSITFMFFSCASAPAPAPPKSTPPEAKTHSKMLTNPDYLYSLTLPEGWEESNPPPGWEGIIQRLNVYLADFEGEHTMIGNDQTGGVMLIFSMTVDLIWEGDEKTSAEDLKETRNEIMEMVAEDWEVTSTEVYPDNLLQTHRNWIENPVQFKPERFVDVAFSGPTRIGYLYGIVSLVAYPYNSQKTGSLFIWVFSDRHELKNNLVDYKKIVASLRVYGDRNDIPEDLQGRP